MILQGFVKCDEVDYTMRRYFGLLYGHMGRYATFGHTCITPVIMVTESCQKRKFILETFCRKLS